MPLNIPGVPIATGKADQTPQVSDHPAHHNVIAGAVNALEAQLRSAPDRLDDIERALQNAPDGRSGWRTTSVAMQAGAGGTPGLVDSDAAFYRVHDGIATVHIEYTSGGGTLDERDDAFWRISIGATLPRASAQVRLIGTWRGDIWPQSGGSTAMNYGGLIWTGTGDPYVLAFPTNRDGDIYTYPINRVLTGGLYAQLSFPTTASDTSG